MLTTPIRLYLNIYRPRLRAIGPTSSDRLFLSSLGRPIYPKALATEIAKVTHAVFGLRITPRDFRHAAGSSIARESPAQVGITPSILGHKDFRTSERCYIWVDQYSAFRALDDALVKVGLFMRVTMNGCSSRSRFSVVGTGSRALAVASQRGARRMPPRNGARNH